MSSITSAATGARSAYQDFCAICEDADPHISILKEAKACEVELVTSAAAHFLGGAISE